MSENRPNDAPPWFQSWVGRVGLVLFATAAFVALAIALEDALKIGFETTYRVACGGICLFGIFKLRLDNPGERWLLTSFWIALIVNVAIFFTPIVDRPASRGEILIFALPDTIVVLIASIASYQVVEARQRVVRQLMWVALVVATISCATLFAFALNESLSD